MNSDRSHNISFEDTLIEYYLLLKFRIVNLKLIKNKNKKT